MPLADSTVDRVFHCNCYYFSPDIRKGATEIHRVMKPGGLMVTSLRLTHVAAFAAKQVMPSENWRPDSGFTDVRMEDNSTNALLFRLSMPLPQNEIEIKLQVRDCA